MTDSEFLRSSVAPDISPIDSSSAECVIGITDREVPRGELDPVVGARHLAGLLGTLQGVARAGHVTHLHSQVKPELLEPGIAFGLIDRHLELLQRLLGRLQSFTHPEHQRLRLDVVRLLGEHFLERRLGLVDIAEVQIDARQCDTRRWPVRAECRRFEQRARAFEIALFLGDETAVVLRGHRTWRELTHALGGRLGVLGLVEAELHLGQLREGLQGVAAVVLGVVGRRRPA